MYKEHKNFLTKEECIFIENNILNNRVFPWYLSTNSTHLDDLPFLYHNLKDSPEQGNLIRSLDLYIFFEKILSRFCKKNKIKYKKILRACLNFTFKMNEKHCPPHQDHNYKHRQILIYLNDCVDGETLIFKKDKKTIKAKIKPEKYKILFMEDEEHAASYPAYDKRIICVLTFV